MVVLLVAVLNSSIYDVPIQVKTMYMIARENAEGNQRRKPRRKDDDATKSCEGLLRNGVQIVRAEMRMNAE